MHTNTLPTTSAIDGKKTTFSETSIKIEKLVLVKNHHFYHSFEYSCLLNHLSTTINLHQNSPRQNGSFLIFFGPKILMKIFEQINRSKINKPTSQYMALTKGFCHHEYVHRDQSQIVWLHHNQQMSFGAAQKQECSLLALKSSW